MLTIRPAQERGYFDYGWLKTYHTFSFADYRDPQHQRFRHLRVINEDWVSPGQGFGEHPHRDMEIVTYILSGQLEHRDSLGHGSTLKAGEFQRMSAGRGVTHSEFNPSATEPTHLYQIWLFPDEKSIEPSYEQKRFSAAERIGRWQLVASREARDGALKINQDAQIFLADLAAGQSLIYEQLATRHSWLQVLRGSATVSGQLLQAGDGLAVSDEAAWQITSRSDSELMLFDLA